MGVGERRSCDYSSMDGIAEGFCWWQDVRTGGLSACDKKEKKAFEIAMPRGWHRRTVEHFTELTTWTRKDLRPVYLTRQKHQNRAHELAACRPTPTRKELDHSSGGAEKASERHYEHHLLPEHATGQRPASRNCESASCCDTICTALS
jgi:hypothetical protein